MDNVTDSLLKGRIEETFKVSSVDLEESLSLQEGKDKGNPSKLLVTVEAIHAGLTKNKTFYPADSLQSSVDSWTKPYPKPVLTHHNTHGEPVGRVIKAEFKNSVLNPGTQAIQLELSINDEKTIQKVLDKRYMTMSIGGSAKKAVCSVCAKNIVQEGFCGHRKGKSYDGKEAYWIIGEMEFDEVSWVNVPADSNAQVIDIRQSVEDNAERSNEDMTNPDEQLEENVLSDVDKLLQESNVDTSLEDGDGELIKEEEQEPNEEETTDEEEVKESSSEDKLSLLESNNLALEESIKTLQESNNTLTAEVNLLKEEKQQAENKLQEQEQEMNQLKEEKDSFKTKSITLAKLVHKTLVERLADLKTSGEVSRDSIISEYTKVPTKVIQKEIEDLVSKFGEIRQSAKVSNPSLVINSSNHTIEDEEGNIVESTSSEDKQEITIEDLANRLKEFMMRKK